MVLASCAQALSLSVHDASDAEPASAPSAALAAQFGVLGLQPGASWQEVRSAYRRALNAAYAELRDAIGG
jgi:hypothetical protein